MIEQQEWIIEFSSTDPPTVLGMENWEALPGDRLLEVDVCWEKTQINAYHKDAVNQKLSSRCCQTCFDLDVTLRAITGATCNHHHHFSLSAFRQSPNESDGLIDSLWWRESMHRYSGSSLVRLLWKNLQHWSNWFTLDRWRRCSTADSPSLEHLVEHCPSLSVLLSI